MQPLPVIRDFISENATEISIQLHDCVTVNLFLFFNPPKKLLYEVLSCLH